MCRNSATGLPSAFASCAGQPVELLGFAAKSGIHDQRIQSDKAPAGGLEAPAVLADNASETSCGCSSVANCAGASADRGRIVADIVIAGQVEAGDRKCRHAAPWQIRDRRGLVGASKAISPVLTTRSGRVASMRSLTRWKFPVRFLIAAGEVGVGNLGQAKFAHALFLPAGSYMRPGVGIMTTSSRRRRTKIAGIPATWSPQFGRWFKSPPASLSGQAGLAISYFGVRAAAKGDFMSVQMVLLPVFVLVGLTFFLMLWMVTARTRAVKARETSLKDIAAGQPKYPARVAQIGNCFSNQFEVPPPVLLPDRAGAAAAAGRSLHRADVLGVRGDAICPCRHFRHLEQHSTAQPGLVCRHAGAAGDVDLFRAEASASDSLESS